MVRRGHEDELKLAHRFHRQRSFGRRVPGRADDQIGTAGHQCIPATAENFGRQLDARARSFAVKVLQQRKQPLGGNDVVNRDAQLGFPAGGDPLDAALQIGSGAQQMAAFAQ